MEWWSWHNTLTKIPKWLKLSKDKEKYIVDQGTHEFENNTCISCLIRKCPDLPKWLKFSDSKNKWIVVKGAGKTLG